MNRISLKIAHSIAWPIVLMTIHMTTGIEIERMRLCAAHGFSKWNGLVMMAWWTPVTTCFAFNYHDGDRVDSDNDNYKVNFHLNTTTWMCAIGYFRTRRCIDDLLPWNTHQFYWLTSFLLYLSYWSIQNGILWMKWTKTEIIMEHLEKYYEWMRKIQIYLRWQINAINRNNDLILWNYKTKKFFCRKMISWSTVFDCPFCSWFLSVSSFIDRRSHNFVSWVRVKPIRK